MCQAQGKIKGKPGAGRIRGVGKACLLLESYCMWDTSFLSFHRLLPCHQRDIITLVIVAPLHRVGPQQGICLGPPPTHLALLGVTPSTLGGAVMLPLAVGLFVHRQEARGQVCEPVGETAAHPAALPRSLHLEHRYAPWGGWHPTWPGRGHAPRAHNSCRGMGL